MSGRRHYGPDRVEQAGRDAVRGDRAEVSKEEGSMARATGLLRPLRVDGDDERKAARTVAVRSFRHEHELVKEPDGTLRLICHDPVAHAAEREAARGLLDVLGLLPSPEPHAGPEPDPEVEAQAPIPAMPSAERQRLAKLARIEQFAAIMRDNPDLEPEEAAAEMGLRASTGVEYARILKSREQREQYFEARGAGWTREDAGKYAEVTPSQRKAHEKAWREHQLDLAAGIGDGP